MKTSLLLLFLSLNVGVKVVYGMSKSAFIEDLKKKISQAKIAMKIKKNSEFTDVVRLFEKEVTDCIKKIEVNAKKENLVEVEADPETVEIFNGLMKMVMDIRNTKANEEVTNKSKKFKRYINSLSAVSINVSCIFEDATFGDRLTMENFCDFKVNQKEQEDKGEAGGGSKGGAESGAKGGNNGGSNGEKNMKGPNMPKGGVKDLKNSGVKAPSFG